MKLQIIRWMMVITLAGQLALPWAWGSQIVTQQDRQWAAEVLARLDQEKMFPPQDSPGTLGLLYFSNHTGRPELDPLEKGLSAMLAADLSKIKAIQLVPRGRIEALMEALKLDVADLNDPVRMPRMGRLLGATYVLGGTLEEGQLAELSIIPQLLEVPNDIILEQPLVSGEVTQLAKMQKALLAGVIEKMNLQLSPEEATAIQQPHTVNTIALNSFFRGLEQGDQGNYTAAFNLYEMALAEDPNLELAQTAKIELVDLGLVTSQGALVKGGQKAAAVSAQPETAAAEVESSPAETQGNQRQAETRSGGLNRPLLIGAGVAAVAIGIGVAAGGGGGGSTDEPEPGEPQPEDPETPRIISTEPDNLATGVPRSLTVITFQFSTAMDVTQGSISSDTPTWRVNTNAVLEWSEDAVTLTLRRLDEEDLPSGSEINLTLTGFSSQAGASLPNFNYTATVEIY
ncbi:MAG: hypothetical protein WBG37_03320 [Desulfobacterales bacterium]